MSSKKLSSVVAGAAIISGGMFLSRILGLVRENMLLNTFGATDISGAYNLAFVVPDLFYNLLAGGALSAAFIPVFTSYLTREKYEDAHRVGSTIITLLTLVMTACALIGIIFAPQLVSLVKLIQPSDREFNPATIALTISLTRVMCLMLIFTGLSGLLTGILHSYRHFLAPVVVWLVYNVSIMLGIMVFSKMPLFGGSPVHGHESIHGVAIGVVFGALLMALIQFPVVLKHGFRFQPVLDLAHEGVQKMMKLFGPVVVSMAMGQVNLTLLPIILGASFGYPAVTDIRAANRIVLAPLGIFAMAISAAAFPQLAQLAAQGEKDGFRLTLSRAMKAIILLSVPIMVALFVLAEPLTYMLWGGGKFGAQGVQASAFVVMFFVWALLGLGLVQVVNRAFYSLHEMMTPVICGVSMVVLNIPLTLLLAHYTSLEYGSAALSTTLTTTGSTLVLIEMLRRKMNGIGGRSITIMTLKVVAASALMGVVLFVVAKGLAPTFMGEKLVPIFRWPAPPVPFSLDVAAVQEVHVPRLPLLIQVGISGTLGFLTYLGALWLLRVDELSLLTSRIMSKLRRSERPAAV